MKKRMFVLTVAAVFILGLTIGFFATTEISHVHLEAYIDTVHDDAEYLLTVHAAGLPVENAAEAASTAVDAGVLVADTGGTILAETGPVQAQGLLDLPEIQEALASGSGYAEREINGQSRIYVARYFSEQGLLVRFDQSANAVYGDVRSMQWSIWILLGVLMILTLALAWRFSDITMAPFNEMVEIAREYANSDYSRRLPATHRKDLATLAEALDTMRTQLISGSDELVDEKIKVEATLDAIASGVIAVDRQMNIIRCNAAAMHLFHIGTASVGKNFLTLTQNIRLASLMQRAMNNWENSAEETIPMQDRMIRVRASKLKRSGQVAGAVIVADDITEYNRLLNIRTEFTANVTHELKTPLTSIRGFVETLQNGVEDQQQARRFLEIIANETERLTRLIDDILYLSELESRPEELPVPVDVWACAENTLELLQAEADEKRITLSLREKTDDAAYVSGTDDQVMQLLVNLVSNGIRYTPAGGSVRITVKTTAKDVVLDVTDTGIGIEEEAIPRLFERFYRVDKGRSREQGGTGLGLAIVKHIVLGMGGTISVSSKVGKGTSFTVHLPKA